MKKLYFDIESYRYGGDVLNPDDEWSDRSDEIVELKIPSATFDRGKEFWPNESFDVPDHFESCDVLYVTVARYSDGDTFGQSYGLYKICFVSDVLQEANDYNPETKSDYKPWVGYFSSYEKTEVYTVQILKEKK